MQKANQNQKVIVKIKKTNYNKKKDVLSFFILHNVDDIYNLLLFLHLIYENKSQ